MIRRGLLAGGFGLGFPSKRITEIAPVVAQSPNNVLSARELQEREKAEADRRAKALERMSHKSANEGSAYPFSDRPPSTSRSSRRVLLAMALLLAEAVLTCITTTRTRTAFAR